MDFRGFFLKKKGGKNNPCSPKPARAGIDEERKRRKAVRRSRWMGDGKYSDHMMNVIMSLIIKIL